MKPPANMLASTASKFVSGLTLLLVSAALWRWRELVAAEWIWLSGFIATLAIRIPHSRRNAGNGILSAMNSPREALALVLLLLTAMVLPLALLATGFASMLDYSLPIGFIVPGLALQLLSTWLFYRSHADLVRNWSPGLEIRQGHELVTRGVYRQIRHPMYLAVLISALAQPLLICNWLAGPPAILVLIGFLWLRIPAEERMMARHFGNEYSDYCACTCRLLPLRYVR